MASIGETNTTYRVEFPDVPVVNIGDVTAIETLLEDPDYFISEALGGTQWEDVKRETIVIDSATMLSHLYLGRPAKRDDKGRVLRQGTGIMATDRTRESGPSIEDYRELNWAMTNFFNGLRNLNTDYHTVVTAHAAVTETENDARRTLKEKSRNPGESIGLPVLPGKLKWHADNMCDFFIYCESRREGRGLNFYAHTIQRGMWHARTKLYGTIDESIVDPTFDKIYNVYLNSTGGID